MQLSGERGEMMTTANIELTFEQLLAAVRKLSYMDKVRLWRTLGDEVDRDQIRRRAAEAVQAIWSANEGVNEDEVMADIDAALGEIRAENEARRS